MFFSFFRNRRRQWWLAQPVPSSWLTWLRSNVWQYRYLSPQQRVQVERFACILFHEKRWEGGSGFAVTDEMRVTIAGQAALATLGFEKPYYFERLRTIIVYATTFTAKGATSENLLLGSLSPAIHDFSARTGESWPGGPVILSWDSVLRDGRNHHTGQNVVLHEFAHQMDALDGSTDGAPPLTDYKFEQEWYRVTEAEYDHLRALARRGERTLLSHYGATNQAEFFAVSTECFFTQPHELAEQHSELYAVLCRLFGQDPRQWLPRLHRGITG